MPSQPFKKYCLFPVSPSWLAVPPSGCAGNTHYTQHACTCMHIHTCARPRTHKHKTLTHYLHTHTHTHTHTITHTLTQLSSQVVCNCISALNEILSEEGGMVVNTKIAHYLLNRWGALEGGGNISTSYAQESSVMG